MRLLLAESDQFLADGLSLILCDNGYSIDVATNGLDAETALTTRPYDLLILNLGLPKLDGMEILKRLRERGQSLPVLVLAARDCFDDRINKAVLGVDDYITIPFELSRLESSIRALLKDVSGEIQ